METYPSSQGQVDSKTSIWAVQEGNVSEALGRDIGADDVVAALRWQTPKSKKNKKKVCVDSQVMSWNCNRAPTPDGAVKS